MIRAAALCLALVAQHAAACEIDPASQTAYPESLVYDDTTAGAVKRAWYADPVTRYQHFVLGRTTEPETLWIDAHGNRGLCSHALTLGPDHVFEDLAPRLADLDGDGQNEVIVVRSHARQGAQLAVYRWTGTDLVLEAATPYIGRANRWLAPVGVADLDGDGAVEIAFVDRPHLARTLRIWRYAGGALVEVAALAGVTNHRIGAPFIVGGIRECGTGPEMLLADAAWSQMVALRLVDGEVVADAIGTDTSQTAFASRLACPS